MPNTRVVYTSVKEGLPHTDRDETCMMPLEGIIAHIHEIRALPDLATYEGSVAEGGIEGTRGSVSIMTDATVCHAYFVADEEFVDDRVVDVELASLEDPKSGFVRRMLSIAQLEDVVRILDSGQSPFTYVLANGLSVHGDSGRATD